MFASVSGDAGDSPFTGTSQGRSPGAEKLARGSVEPPEGGNDLERLRAALLETQEKYRHIVENAPAGVYEVDFLRGKFLEVNDVMCHYLGYSREEFLGMSVLEILTEKSRANFLARLGDLTEGRPIAKSTDYEVVAKNGRRFWVRLQSTFHHEGGKLRGATVVVHDLTDRKRAEEALLESEERFAATLDAVPEVVFEIAEDGTVLYLNRMALHVLGFTLGDLGTLTVSRILDEKGQESVLQRFQRPHTRRESARNFRLHLRTSAGEAIPAEANVILLEHRNRAASLLGIARDITNRIRAEEEKARLEDHLRRAQRLEAIGTLAGGIAHDFNNILTIMMGYTELSLAKVPQSSDERFCLEQVHQAGVRAKELVDQILTFSRSRQGARSRQPVEVDAMLKEVLKFIRASLPATIEIRSRIPGSAGRVLADPIQIHQVMMNLFTNAAQAMREKGGLLTVTLAEEVLSAGTLDADPTLAPGAYLRLDVSDTGPGMESHVLERCFDPFFTTKAVGEGTGMGLAVVHGIVRSHGGAVTVRSEPGKGVTFQVLLPVHAQAPPEVAPPETPSPAPGVCVRILFVDDEPSVVEFGRKALEHLGHSVVACSGSLEALDVFRRRPEAFDLVITDMTMPGMTGVELAEALRRIRPDVCILLCTGFSDAVSQESASRMGFTGFLMKPYRPQDLDVSIRAALA